MALPPELVEQIIDNLAQQNPEPDELLVYSVIARAWRPRALYYVFRTIYVSNMAWGRSSATAGLAFDPDSFTRMWYSAPHLLCYLRHLALRIDGNVAQQEKITRFALTLSFPAPCAVQTLRFEDYTHVQGWVSFFDNFALRFPTLRRIELCISYMLPLEEIANATSVAQELALVIPGAFSEILHESEVPIDTDSRTTVHNLRILDLENSDHFMSTKFYADVARLCTCAPNLQQIAVTQLSKTALQRYIPASSALKDYIQELQIDTEKLTQNDVDGVLLHHPNLRVLRLDAHGPRRQLPFPSASRTLERLCFTIHNVYAGSWTPRMFENSCDWPALDYCASSHAMMPSMQKLFLTFIISSPDLIGWETTLGTLAKSHLPQLHSAGMLEWSVAQRKGVRSMGGSVGVEPLYHRSH